MNNDAAQSAVRVSSLSRPYILWGCNKWGSSGDPIDHGFLGRRPYTAMHRQCCPKDAIWLDKSGLPRCHGLHGQMAHSALRPSIFHLVSWPNLAASLGSRGARSFEDLICVQTPVMEIEWALCEASRVTCPAHAFHLGARPPHYVLHCLEAGCVSLLLHLSDTQCFSGNDYA